MAPAEDKVAQQSNGLAQRNVHFHSSLSAAIEQAHAELWNTRIDKQGIVRDYVGETPTPEDCSLGRPNAMGWWSPIENGPMFTGTYLAAICERARRSGEAADREDAMRLAQGLLKCASVSEVPGFIARGVGTDGKCHYPLGSQDQIHPWFYGLHAYAASGVPDAEERRAVVARLTEVAEALEALNWKCPCDGAFKGQSRGDFKMFRHHGAVMYLSILRAMADVTNDPIWLERYHTALNERANKNGRTRLEICAEGYPYDREQIKNIDQNLLWIYVSSQGALSRLAGLETDETIRAQYRAGLAANARGALAVIGNYRRFDNNDTKLIGHANWRVAYPTWVPQATQAEAERLSSKADKEKCGERKGYESGYMRNPLAAASIVAFAGDETGRELIEGAIRHYDYSKIHMSEFLFAECAFYGLTIKE